MLIVDAHLDLAMNAMEWNRDLSRPLQELRAREAGMSDRPDREHGTVSFEEMRRGGVAICVATQIARYVKPNNRLSGWRSPEQAWAMTQAQLAWYGEMTDRGELTPLTDLDSLDRHVALLGPFDRDFDRTVPIGFVLSLEGADSIVTLGHLERAYARGLRAIGPAHYGPGTYAQGTDASGGIGVKGRDLLREMDRLAMILDVTHLCDDSFWEAVDVFKGPVWASHSNCRALVPHNRQFSDEQIRYLVDRGAVIGAALDAWMLVPGWVRGTSTPRDAQVTLDTLVNHIEHVSSIAGSARHSMIGSDLDGAFGTEQTAADLDSIADLARLLERLRARGFSADDVQGIAHGNFLRVLREAWK